MKKWGHPAQEYGMGEEGDTLPKSHVERETWCCWWQLGEVALEKGLCTEHTNGHRRTQDMMGKETQDFQVQA